MSLAESVASRKDRAVSDALFLFMSIALLNALVNAAFVLRAINAIIASRARPFPLCGRETLFALERASPCAPDRCTCLTYEKTSRVFTFTPDARCEISGDAYDKGGGRTGVLRATAALCSAR